MNKIISIASLLILATGLGACAGSAPYSGNSPEQQRSNAKDAQKELSTDVKR